MKTEIVTRSATIRVQPTRDLSPTTTLGAVTVGMNVGGTASFQDYLTADQAREFAAALIEAADEADRAS